MGGQVLADARRGKHAAIANQHHAAEPEAPPQLVDLGGHGGGVAGAHLGGNRAARGVAQQADEDLAAATLAVAGVAAAGQLAVLAGVPDGGQVVQREAAVLQVAAGQFGLDGGLAAGQPVEGVVELLLGDGTQAEGLCCISLCFDKILQIIPMQGRGILWINSLLQERVTVASLTETYGSTGPLPGPNSLLQ